MPQSILEESRQARRPRLIKIVFKKRFWIILALIVVLAAGAFYFYQKNHKVKSVNTTVKQATATLGDLVISIQSEGKVVAKDGVELSFPVSGNLEVSGVYVKEGDKIVKGDKIASVKTESLEFELRNAYASYQSALASYNTKTAGATDSEISKAKASIEQASVSLEQTKISAERTKDSAAKSIADAEDALETALENLNENKNVATSEAVETAYEDLFSSIKSVSISLQKYLHDSDTILGIDETAINDDFENVLGAKNSFSLNQSKDSYNIVKELKNSLDADIAQLSLNLDYGLVDEAAATAVEAIDEFQNHLYSMQTMLDATITAANLSQTKLDGFKTTINSNRSSANSLASSLNNYIESVDDAKDTLADYQTAYDDALADLATAKKEAEQDINNASTSLKSKQLSYDQAKLDYQDLIAPMSTNDLSSARAQLNSAAISVDKAKYNMEQATLVSPIDGVVSMLNYKVGDIILSDSAKTMATIINNDTLFIEVNIEEADISQLKVGQKAKVSFDAIAGLEIEGELSFISLTSSTSTNGIVTYLVRVLLSNVSESSIREGMTASVEFITSGVEDVLYIPVSAVRNVGGKPSVQTKAGEYVNVSTGFTDGEQVEITSGLEAGQVVIY